jgi:hypothetical protein
VGSTGLGWLVFGGLHGQPRSWLLGSHGKLRFWLVGFWGDYMGSLGLGWWVFGGQPRSLLVGSWEDRMGSPGFGWWRFGGTTWAARSWLVGILKDQGGKEGGRKARVREAGLDIIYNSPSLTGGEQQQQCSLILLLLVLLVCFKSQRFVILDMLSRRRCLLRDAVGRLFALT